MRRGYNCFFIRDTHGEIFGINLGADFTAEHEWGIKTINQYFDIKHELDGFDGRKNNKFPNDKEPSLELDGHGEMYILEQKDLYGIVFNFPKKYVNGLLKTELRIYNNDEYYRNRCSTVNGIKDKDQKDLACAWDERSFAFVTTPTIERKAFVNKLFESFMNLNGVVMLGGRAGIIDNAGLILLNYNKIPDDIKEEFKNEDIKAKKDQKLYKKLEKESGVFEALKKSNKTFFYLGIRSLDENGNPRWWLNPMEQQKYEAGWFSTKDLLDWANDKGKVIIKTRSKRR